MSAARVALITGASSGIGRALAHELAAGGWSVGLAARRGELLASLAAEIDARGGQACWVALDVGDRDAVRAGVIKIEAGLGPIDLLVTNAGIARHTDPVGLSSVALEAELRTNVLGSFYVMEAVVPGMLARGRGHVAAVSSIAGWLALPGEGGYSASKAALTRLVESLGIDWARHGVSTTVVHPGFVRTAIVAGADHPMPFLLEPEQAARIIVRAIRRKARRCDFPRRMVWLARLARLLPDPVVHWVNVRARRSRRQEG